MEKQFEGACFIHCHPRLTDLHVVQFSQREKHVVKVFQREKLADEYLQLL